MSKTDNKPEAEPVGPDDPLSATDMFLGAFGRQDNPAPMPVKPAQRPAGEAIPVAPGEFTQIFGSLKASAPTPPVVAAPEQKKVDSSAGVTRIFPASVPPAADGPVAPAKRKGYSSPGGSDSASAEGSFTQIFQRTSPPAGSPSMTPEDGWPFSLDTAQNARPSDGTKEAFGITGLIDALSPTYKAKVVRPTTTRSSPPVPVGDPDESLTGFLDRLTTNKPAAQIPDSQPSIFEVDSPADPGDFTLRFDDKSAYRAAPRAAAATKPEMPAGEKTMVMPTPAAPSVVPAPSKLQEMIPILLLVNAFLLVAVIVLIIFVLLRR